MTNIFPKLNWFTILGDAKIIIITKKKETPKQQQQFVELFGWDSVDFII